MLELNVGAQHTHFPLWSQQQETTTGEVGGRSGEPLEPLEQLQAAGGQTDQRLVRVMQADDANRLGGGPCTHTVTFYQHDFAVSAARQLKGRARAGGPTPQDYDVCGRQPGRPPGGATTLPCPARTCRGAISASTQVFP